MADCTVKRIYELTLNAYEKEILLNDIKRILDAEKHIGSSPRLSALQDIADALCHSVDTDR